MNSSGRPARIFTKMEHPIVLFDGICNFCNAVVNFLIRQDKKKALRFAAMQSNAGKQLLTQHGFPADYLKSFVLIKEGKAYTQSTAALKLYNQLPWYWKWMQVFWIVPRPLRDSMYNFISDKRYGWFGKKARCMLPAPDVRNRFL